MESKSETVIGLMLLFLFAIVTSFLSNINWIIFLAILIINMPNGKDFNWLLFFAVFINLKSKLCLDAKYTEFSERINNITGKGKDAFDSLISLIIKRSKKVEEDKREDFTSEKFYEDLARSNK